MNNNDFVATCCEYILSLTGVPITFFRDREQVKRMERVHFEHGNIYETLDKLLSKNSDYAYITEGKFLFGLVKDKFSSYSILLGPFKVLQIERFEIKKIAFDYDIKEQSEGELSSFVDSLAFFTIPYCIQLISFVYLLVNKEQVSTLDFQFRDNDTRIDKFYDEFSNKMDFQDANNNEKNQSLDFEKYMLYYIENGQTDNLVNYLTSSPIRKTGQVAYGIIRQEKNNAIISLTLASRAAIKGGLDPETAFSISDLVIQKVENIDNINEINQLTYTSLLDLSNRVSEIKKAHSDTPLIERTIQYINQHVAEKLSVNDIAKHFKTNRSFLSDKFSKETGISMNEYINIQKVSEAKRLLSFTDKSLIEISNYLSFSSQSHFNNVFKRIEGVTPLSYRKSKK